MTSNQISPEAEARREAARVNGKFGTQAHTAPAVDVLASDSDLDPSGAVERLARDGHTAWTNLDGSPGSIEVLSWGRTSTGARLDIFPGPGLQAEVVDLDFDAAGIATARPDQPASLTAQQVATDAINTRAALDAMNEAVFHDYRPDGNFGHANCSMAAAMGPGHSPSVTASVMVRCLEEQRSAIYADAERGSFDPGSAERYVKNAMATDDWMRRNATPEALDDFTDDTQEEVQQCRSQATRNLFPRDSFTHDPVVRHTDRMLQVRTEQAREVLKADDRAEAMARFVAAEPAVAEASAWTGGLS